MQSVGDTCAQFSVNQRSARTGQSHSHGQDRRFQYFEQTEGKSGYHQRLHALQEFALANLSGSAYRVWDWIERTLQRQHYYHPEQAAVLKGVALSCIVDKLNYWAPPEKKISQRTVERAVQELRLKGFLQVTHRFRTLDDGARQQLPSDYSLLLPPAVQVILNQGASRETPGPSVSVRKTHKAPTDKTGKHPATKSSGLKPENTKKEKGQGVLSPGQTVKGAPPDNTSPVEGDLLQYWWQDQRLSLHEACLLLEKARNLWRTGETAPLAGVLITEVGWERLN